jgi:ElaB/YqjD/DUF883 family membrane-anchored ribosome-binding protein
MADVHGSTSTTDAPGTRTPVQHTPSSAAEQREWMQAAAQEVSHKVQEMAQQGQEAAAEYYQQGRERVLAWQQQLEHQVREKPIQSLMVAAGLGLLFGLLRRR